MFAMFTMFACTSYSLVTASLGLLFREIGKFQLSAEALVAGKNRHKVSCHRSPSYSHKIILYEIGGICVSTILFNNN